MINEINMYMGGFDDGRTPSVQQYDVKSRKYLIHLWRHPGEAYQMAEDAIVGAVFKWRGSFGGKEYETDVQDRSTVLVTVPAEAMERSGVIRMQLLIHQNGGLLHGPVIHFMALESLEAGDKATDEPVPLLVALVDDVRVALAEMDAATESIDNMQVVAVEADAPSASLETVDGAKVLTLGLVRGAKGDEGAGIKSVSLNASGQMTVKYTDNRSQFLAQSLKGADGYSPTVFVMTGVDAAGKYYQITFTDRNGSETIVLRDGTAANAIDTAIIKSSNYDVIAGGGTPTESATYECVNMTFDEAVALMKSGKPLQVCMMRAYEPDELETVMYSTVTCKYIHSEEECFIQFEDWVWSKNGIGQIN